MEKKKKVLVVDDDNDLLDMVSLVLSTSGMDVHCINNGSSFMESLKKTSPDIILMDIFLGDADGRELCLSLKNDTSLSRIPPVILYSAGHIIQSSILECRADRFLPKPFGNSDLLNTINSLV
jgi:DNA-binding response OmpR family regulator